MAGEEESNQPKRLDATARHPKGDGFDCNHLLMLAPVAAKRDSYILQTISTT